MDTSSEQTPVLPAAPAPTPGPQAALVFPLTLPGNPLRRAARVGVGQLVLLARPTLVARFESGEVPRGRLERAALAALVDRYRKSGQLDRLVRQHAHFWASDATLPFYARSSHRLQRMFTGEHRPLVEAFEKTLQEGRYHTLCEIGCGSGVTLAYFAGRLPGITRFVGLDLNAAQIARNVAHYREDPRLSFIAGDAAEWIARNASPGTAWFAYGGVFEYFTRAQLEALFTAIAGQVPTCLALVEPIGPDHDVDADPVTRPYGFELSNSHPYPRLLADAGMAVAWRGECIAANTRWVMLVAQR